MSARIARRAFTATARRSVLKPAFPSSASRVTRRNASTSSPDGSESSSDKPWIIGSLLIFGPALLYLLSPSARKSHHVEHNSHDEHSEVTQDKTPEPELMKDDEGAVADVASSITLAESSDVPNDAQSAGKYAELKAAAEDDSSKPVVQDSAGAPPSTDEGEKSDQGETAERAEEGDRKLPKAPTNMGEAREAAVAHVTPKEDAESKD